MHDFRGTLPTDLESTSHVSSNIWCFMRFSDFSCCGKRLAGAIVAACLLGTPPADASITGVCPDGSMFIVNKEADIPCRAAKRVEPHDMPPIRPAYLPRPHAWQVFQSQQDPNNPYNLIDRAKDVRDAARPQPSEEHRAALPAVSAAPAVATPPTLDAAELRDLGLIVGLRQDSIPARFQGGPQGTLGIDLAHSRAFEARLHAHFAGGSLGPVVVFSVSTDAPSAFHANFTFVQGHVAFHPEPNDPRQLGILAGTLGDLAAGARVLGYAVLPEGIDLSRPTDVYWNDRRISVALLR